VTDQRDWLFYRAARNVLEFVQQQFDHLEAELAKNL